MGGNTPSELSNFVGREEEVLRLSEILSRVRILTLVGPGGVGKSRLGLRVALSVSSRYPDGTWLVDLTSVEDPAELPRAVGDVLGVPHSAEHSLTEVIVSALVDRRVLLLLDNAEHVRQACAEFASRLIETCPHVDVICTSREPLRVTAERRWRVASLSLPGSAELTLARLQASEAVQLFLARARERVPCFDATERNLRLIAQICLYLDGLPLAIELAAVRVESFDLAELVTRLEAGLALRITGPRTAHARHQTLRATIAWSHRLLSDVERLVFRRLAVFARAWTLDGARYVCSGSDLPEPTVDAALWRLVSCSLVVCDDGDGHSRFRMLETIRAYAYEQLAAAEETPDLHRRHAEYMVQLVEPVDPESLDAVQAAVFESEQEDLRAALKWAINANEGNIASHLARGLYTLWYLRGYYSEGRAWLERVLSLGETQTASLRSDCAMYLTRLKILQGEFSAARAWLDSSSAETIQRVATIAMLRGDPEQAREFLEGAVPRLSSLGLASALNALCNVGMAAVELGATDLALSSAAGCEAASASQPLGHVAALFLRGAAAAIQGNPPQAEKLLNEALRLERSLGFRLLRSMVMIELAHALLDQDEISEAQKLLGEVIQTTYEASERLSCARGIEASARSLAAGQPAEALRFSAAAEAMYERFGVKAWPRDAQRRAQWQPVVRTAFGQGTYDAFWAAGMALTEAEVVQSVRAALETQPRPAGDEAATLTPREIEVALLLAAGRSTMEIADELTISGSTVRVHIEHIMAKLDLHTRTQVVLWVREFDIQSSYDTRRRGAAATGATS